MALIERPGTFGAEEEGPADAEGIDPEDEMDGAMATAATGAAAAVLTGVDPREERSKNERNCRLLLSPVAVPAVARLAACCVGDVSDE